MEKNLRIVTGGTVFYRLCSGRRFSESGKEVIVVGRFREKNPRDLRRPRASHGLGCFRRIIHRYRCPLRAFGASGGRQHRRGRWTSTRKKEIETSRIETTQYIARCATRWGAVAPRFFSASGVGIYGSQTVTERHCLNLSTKVRPSMEQPVNFYQISPLPGTCLERGGGCRSARCIFAFWRGAWQRRGVLQHLALPFYPVFGRTYGNGFNSL